jgi:type I restriction-modification system DNA methylase subunit
LSREAPFQDRLRDVIQRVIAKFRFDGLAFSAVERGFRVDAREPDLTLLDEARRPFLVIETKRKIETTRYRALFQPLGKAAVGQAISYVALWEEGGRGHIPFFATATPSEIAVFKTPENVLDYVDMGKVQSREYEDVIKPGSFTRLLKHLVFHGKLELTEEFVEKLLDTLAKDYLKTKPSRVPPSWALIEFLRGFVEVLSEKCKPMVKLKLESEQEFKRTLEEMRVKLGYTPDVENLSRMMAYILMNKLVFYKVLEQRYRGLPRLINLPTSSKTDFMRALNDYFERALTETGDFEPIFKTGVYDQIDLPDEPDTLEFINEFIATLEGVRVEEIGDYLNYIYEELIPPGERHQLGQFYTPPAICELIAKWAIRSPDDLVLDPGCGSGGFLSAAYRVLVKLKTGRDSIPPPKGVHEKIIAQLYGVDINPFPAHLSAVSLAMKDVRSPSTGLNIIEHDFFYVAPNTKLLAPYTIRTVAGVEFRREVVIPTFDAVLGNPPYTRWVEIPEPTKNAIRSRLREEIEKYGLTPQLSRGVEPGIYTYWIMHATKFLKQGGRLAMIISNLWMQTEYGIGFGQFLLDNYRIKAIIDFTLRLFTALISTCVLLLEREEDGSKRAENEVVFMHIPGTVESINVDEILKAIEEKKSEKLYVKVVKQKDIPRDEKWIRVFFGLEEVFKHPLMVKLSGLFEPSRGNTYWSIWALQHGKRPDPGASDFAYLSPSKVKRFNLEEFSYPNAPLDQAIVYPAITSARDPVYFTFTEDDWKGLYDRDKECLMFICHKPKNKLPKEVLEYIRWGEPVCPECGKGLTMAGNVFRCENEHSVPLEDKCVTGLRGSRGGGRLACDTESAKVRAKNKKFYGWYDLGGVEPAPLFAIRQARYKTRFMLCRFPVAMYDALIALIPKPEASLTDGQIKALLAYLNSSLTQYYIETRGRYIAKGPIGLEVDMVREMPILDVRKLPDGLVAELASLFDRLEAEARRIGGASEKEQLEKLKPIIYEIDRTLAKLLDIPEEAVKIFEEQVDMLVERRVAGSKEERRESVRGESEVKLKPPRRRRRTEPQSNSTPLDHFIT